MAANMRSASPRSNGAESANVVVPLEVGRQPQMEMRASALTMPPDAVAQCRDRNWIAVLVLGVVVFVSVVIDDSSAQGPWAKMIVYVALIDLGVVLASAIIALFFACFLPHLFILAVFIFGILCGLYIASLDIFWGIVVLIVVIGFYLYSAKRIPFAVATMRISSRSLVQYPSVLALSAAGTVVVAGLYMAGAVFVNAMSPGFYFGLAAQLYLVQVVTMIAQCTTAGVAASCFYFAESAAGRTWQALRRSCTTSLGSIACAALTQSVVSAVNFFLITIPVIGWCVRFCLGAAFGSYRTYVLCYVAVYGSSLKDAAVSANQLLKSSGLNALVNDNLIDPVLNMVTFVASVLSIAATLDAVKPEREFRSEYDWIEDLMLAIASAFMTVMMSGVALQPIRTATATLLVCWSDDPEAVKQTARPEDYAMMVDAARGRSADLNVRFQ